MPVLTQNAELAESRTEETPAQRAAHLAPSRAFKYYIHDSVSTLRFQLIGDLRDVNVTELNGSWQTAQTTLNLRKLVLDLSQLESADPQGRRWLAEMKNIGATFLPAEYLESPAPAVRPLTAKRATPGLTDRMLAIFKPKP
jgi:hypothetical protein